MTLHVVPDKECGVWKLMQDMAQKSSGNFETQKEAIEVAKQIAKNKKEELAIHGTNGQIREKWSYGNDLFPPKG